MDSAVDLAEVSGSLLHQRVTNPDGESCSTDILLDGEVTGLENVFVGDGASKEDFVKASSERCPVEATNTALEPNDGRDEAVVLTRSSWELFNINLPALCSVLGVTERVTALVEEVDFALADTHDGDDGVADEGGFFDLASGDREGVNRRILDLVRLARDGEFGSHHVVTNAVDVLCRD